MYHNCHAALSPPLNVCEPSHGTIMYSCQLLPGQYELADSDSRVQILGPMQPQNADKG